MARFEKRKNRGIAPPAESMYAKGGGWRRLAGPDQGHPGSEWIPNSPDIGDLVGPGGAEPGSRPYTLTCHDVLAAGAITAGTAAVDLYTAACSNDVTTDNRIPGNFECFEVKLFCGAQLNTISANETLGTFGQLYLLELVNNVEVGRYPLWKMGLCIGSVGGVTSGLAAMQTPEISPFGVPWHRQFNENIAYGLELHAAITVTTISITDWSLQHFGVIGANF